MSNYRGSSNRRFNNNKRQSHNEHDDRTVHYEPERKSFGGSFKRRPRPFQKRGGYFDSRGRGRGVRPLSRLDEDDVDMGGDKQHTSRHRTPPYRGIRSGGGQRSRGRGGRGRPNNDRLQKIGMAAAEVIQSQTHSSKSDMYKVQIAHGRTIGQDFILQSISERLSGTFAPVKFHLDQRNAVFHIHGHQVASEIRKMTDQITTPNGYKMIIRVWQNDIPPTSLTEEVIDKLKICMSNRYDVATKTLNMDFLYNDGDLNKEGIFLALSKVQVINEVMGIIKANIPELLVLKMNNNRLFSLTPLKTLSEDAPNIVHLELGQNMLKNELALNSISNLKLTTLNLDGNPLCDRFNDETSYISAIRRRFPKLQRLDGHDLPPIITFDIEAPTALPQSKESQLGNEPVKTIVCRFIQEYFGVYDGDDRQNLLNAYHEQAIFSMNCNFNKIVTGNQPKFYDYMPESRNLFKVVDNARRAKFLKTGRLNVVSLLSQLPNTQHDVNSFLVDVCHASTTLLTFSVSGVFKERSTKSSSPPFRFFTRVFVTAPQGQGIVIVNEQLFITNASKEQIQKSFKPGPVAQAVASPIPQAATAAVGLSPQLVPIGLTPSSPVPGPSTTPIQSPRPIADPAIKQKMVEQFSLQSQMNVAWSEKCLAENGWDYDKSAKVFLGLKEKNAIPPEAFVK